MKRIGVGLVVACVLTGVVGAARVSAAASVSVLTGDHYGARIFPDDFFTVPDSSMVTGKRVNFRLGVDYPTLNGVVKPACDSTDYSICDSFSELNTLDGFDLQPRVTVPLSGAVRLDSVDDSNFYISDASGKAMSGMRQLTFDPGTNLLAGISDKFLQEDSVYTVTITSGVLDSAGNHIAACGGACTTTFTTRTASGMLVNIRKSLDLPASDPRSAWALAGLSTPASRKATFTQSGVDDVFAAATVTPSVASPLNGIVRNDQDHADASAPLTSSVVPNLIPPISQTGYYAFGSFNSPRYQYASASGHVDNPYGTGNGYTDGEIPPVPTTQTPSPFGYDTLGFIAVTPNPAMCPCPVAIYGPGFTRSDFDIFVTADYNAALGIITVATNPSGHGFGPLSTITVTSAGTATTFLSHGRGRDLDGDGTIGDGLNDGVGPSGHVQPGGAVLPSRKPIDGLQSGLAQTVVDNMVLGRSIAAGFDIPGVGADLAKGKPVMYYGLSFGGIYGTMLMGTDPLFNQGLLNVPGGPIVDIARLSGFRGDLATTLKHSKPSLLNGGPGADGFTEDLPLRNDPPVVMTHPGALQLQELFGLTNWFDRSGSPETFAPRIRLRPDPAWAANPKNVAFQTAYGDQTVPNPTAGTLYRAGELFDRVVYYRNDKTPTYASDPHGWLASPTLAGRTSGEQQLSLFLATGQLLPVNPAWLETTIVTPNNLECLHYADPQTGQPIAPQPFPLSGDCPAAPLHGTLPLSGSASGSPSSPSPSASPPGGPPGSGQPAQIPNTSAARPPGGSALLALIAFTAVVAASVGRKRRAWSGRVKRRGSSGS